MNINYSVINMFRVVTLFFRILVNDTYLIIEKARRVRNGNSAPAMAAVRIKLVLSLTKAIMIVAKRVDAVWHWI